MNSRQIAEKYVYGNHDALTDSQEIKDMIQDIENYAANPNKTIFRGIEIKEGDKLRVTVCKDLVVEGEIIFHDAAYCLRYFWFGGYTNKPLTNYAHSCIFEKID